MNEWEAKVERARLQALLDAYEADRQHQRREGDRNGKLLRALTAGMK
jgi:hypothetical protein